MHREEPCDRGDPGAQGAQRARVPRPRLSSQLLPEFYAFLARVLFYLAPVYLAGYLGLSVIWLLLGAALWMWWRRNRRGKLGRLAAAFEFLDNERQFISRELRGQHLPAWVSRAQRCAAAGAGAGGFGGRGPNVQSAGAQTPGRARVRDACGARAPPGTVCAPGAGTLVPATDPSELRDVGFT